MSDRTGETRDESHEEGADGRAGGPGRRLRAIRGAIRVDRNDRDVIFRETQRLLREIQRRNRLSEEEVVSAFFTMTPDLNADFPAYAAREMGWTDTAMLGAQETAVPGAMDRVVRVLLHARTEAAPRHVYLGEAAAMRPDLAEEGDARGMPVSGAADAPEHGTLLVVGLGLVGGSLALALRRSGLFGEVVGHDRDPAALDLARRAGAVDRVVGDPAGPEGDASLREELPGADVVVLALPVDVLLPWLREQGGRLSRGTVVMDVGSTKAEVVRAMEALPEGVEAVGGHPMAGSEQSGMGAARPDLFHGADWVLVETPRTGGRARELAEDLAEAVGARPFWTEAAVHDRATAATSHAPYVLASALALELADRPREQQVGKLAGPGAADMTRLAGSDPAVIAGILATNWPEVRSALDRYRRRLDGLVGRLDRRWEAAGDGGTGAAAEALREELEPARRARRELLDAWRTEE